MSELTDEQRALVRDLEIVRAGLRDGDLKRAWVQSCLECESPALCLQYPDEEDPTSSVTCPECGSADVILKEVKTNPGVEAAKRLFGDDDNE